MDWVAVDTAKDLPGLRVALGKGSWGAWSECAKNILHVDQVAYVPVPQIPFAENAELLAWTGARNNPIAVFDNEPPRTSWLDILNLAERLSPDPRLLPIDSAQRALVIGLSNELCGEQGLAWRRRVEMAAQSSAAPADGLRGQVMKAAYRASDGDAVAEQQRMAAILANLAGLLHAQKAVGSRYLVGDTITAVDIYWATLSNMMQPMAPDLNPMAPALWERFANLAPVLAQALDPILITHRDHIYATYLPPITFG